MRAPRLATTLAGACLLAAGCTTTVDGVAVDQAPAAVPGPVRALDTILPTSHELSATLGIAPTGLMGQLVEGGADTLLRGVEQTEATPVECVSTTYRLQQVVYGASSVRSVASRSWAAGTVDGPALSGFFGVVQLASPDEAATFFATAAQHWRECDGRTMELQRGAASEQSRITDVRVDGPVVSAVVVHEAGQGSGMPIQRALGVAGDSIVDVEITDVAGARSGGAGGAVDVAALMLDKLTG
ncbi:sensor domain-containing protein [Mycolicibacterium litorale]|uniref:sensor domain-containing protein n=1 Tax=Mycolicibacterium litorale TaxID=758802 RepID=UPI003CF79E09